MVGIVNKSRACHVILGLAYPGFFTMQSTTSHGDLIDDFIDYDPTFSSMIKDKLIPSSTLGLALDAHRGGKIAFCGLLTDVKYEEQMGPNSTTRWT
jgi:hypothetical protein